MKSENPNGKVLTPKTHHSDNNYPKDKTSIQNIVEFYLKDS